MPLPTGQREQIAIRRAQIMLWRVDGKTVPEITKLWNDANPDFQVKEHTVGSDIRISLEKLAKETTMATSAVREMLIMRLDHALSAPKFQAQIERGSLPAIDRMIRFVETYAKLYGANAPTKIAQTDPTGEKTVNSMTDEEREKKILEILEIAEARKVEQDAEADDEDTEE